MRDRGARIRKVLLDVKQHATLVIRQVVKGEHEDSGKKWSDVTCQTRASLSIVQGVMAIERAQIASEGQARVMFGVIMMPKPVEDHREWERLAALDAERRLAIEAVATPVPPDDKAKP